MMDVQKVTLTVAEVEMAVAGLATLRQEKLNADALVRVITLAEAMEPHIRIMAELRNEKIVEYGTVGPNGELPRRIGEVDAGWEMFEKEMTAAAGREVELNVPSLYLSDLWRHVGDGKRQPIDITADAALSLRKILFLGNRPGT
jgi:hypothetical protein